MSLLSNTPVPTPVLTVDDVEDGNISEYSGSTASYSVSPSTLEGNHMITSPVNGNVIVSKPNDGLPNYPAQGDVFSAVTNPKTTSTNPQVMFGAQDELNGYLTSISAGANDRRMGKLDNGSFVTLTQESTSVFTDIPVEEEVTWRTDNTIEYRSFQFDTSTLSRGPQIGSTLTTTDSTFSTEEGIGYRSAGDKANATTDNRWDFYRILDQGGA
jgi:hypothetical protein